MLNMHPIIHDTAFRELHVFTLKDINMVKSDKNEVFRRKRGHLEDEKSSI